MEPGEDAEHFPAWFVRDIHWSRAGLPLAVALLLLAPVARRALSRAAFLIYLQLPIYLLHQYEEHGHGAFKRAINAMLPPGLGPLTDRAIFWINVPGVWGVDAAALALAAGTTPANALVAPYLAILNGALHAAVAAKTRRYNPGLWTALALLIPVGACSVRAIGRASGATRRAHAAGIAGALLLHLLVGVTLIRNGARRRAAR